jgi:hypothetical protein
VSPTYQGAQWRVALFSGFSRRRSFCGDQKNASPSLNSSSLKFEGWIDRMVAVGFGATYGREKQTNSYEFLFGPTTP